MDIDEWNRRELIEARAAMRGLAVGLLLAACTLALLTGGALALLWT